MKKLKIYLDTSVISHLEHPDAPDKMADTHRLWAEIRRGAYDAVISDTTRLELSNCPDEKFDTLTSYLSEIPFTVVPADESVLKIAEKFVDFGILRQKSLDDCRHIAAAIVSGCDAIVSWNFKHIVNRKTMNGVKAIAALEGYDDVLIYTPTILIGGEDDDS
ncbi:MAG: PIN domain-containing protein [Oscillospiraceae bacterium]|jgi:predicted nucleic acid-binding protein|nr:PIN domain-containing protein [Oscillospiraceae bacterium]